MATKIRAAFRPRSLAPHSSPTPLEPQPALAAALRLRELWLKREDRAGGNKIRGLEFLLAGTEPKSVFVTVGASGSTHCLATARLAGSLDCHTVVAVFPQPETDASRHIADAMGAAATLVVRASSQLTLPWAVLRAWRAAHHLGQGRPRWIAGGGADPRAVVGHLLATLELTEQLGAASPPDTIVAPLGTGGTAAGIALGLAWLGWTTRVVAVRVAPRIVANQWRVLRLARRTAGLLRRSGVDFSIARSSMRLEVVDAIGKGYGHPTEEGERARALAAQYGIRLDPTYGAKAFSFFLRHDPKIQRAIFWHTFAWP